MSKTQPPLTNTGVKCVWLISHANSILAQGAPDRNLLMSGWRGNPFPFIGLLLEGQWEQSRWLWALARPDLPTKLVFKKKRMTAPLFRICPHLAGKRDCWPVAPVRGKSEFFSRNSCDLWEKIGLSSWTDLGSNIKATGPPWIGWR